MKKLLTLFVLVCSASLFAQTSGITYQAVILNPEGQHIPGHNNQRSPVVNKNICMRFTIHTGTNAEYQETQQTTTDEFGMVNLIIGTGSPAGGSAATFGDIVWDGNPKNLHVEVSLTGICSNFLEISDQPLTAVPYALYAANSGTAGPQGEEGNLTLVNTTTEAAGTNCATGGVKLEFGVDINRNGTLETEEIATGLTKYVCNGAAGPQGSAGSAGPAGPAGPQGVAGATGAQGAQGLQGVPGPAGATGAQGPQGTAGINGLSAYQVAVANGYVGTEQQWLTSIQGAAGTNGQSAYQVAVANGYTGTQTEWLASLVGAQGPQGPAGSGSGSIGANASFSDAVIEFNSNNDRFQQVEYYCLSSNGKHILLSYPYFYTLDSNGLQTSNIGKVKVMKYENGALVQVGNEIVGTAADQRLGLWNGINGNGDTIFITRSNVIEVYKFINNDWVFQSTLTVQPYLPKISDDGNIIVNQNFPGSSNTSVSFNISRFNGSTWIEDVPLLTSFVGYGITYDMSPDGNTIAVSNSSINKTEIYNYNGTTWNMMGMPIQILPAANWGMNMCISRDGLKVAIARQFSNEKQIKTYEYINNSWTQYGSDISFSYFYNQSNFSVNYISYDIEGNTLIVIYDGTHNGIPSNFIVRYKYIDNNWAQVGSKITIEKQAGGININADYFQSGGFENNVLIYGLNYNLTIKDYN